LDFGTGLADSGAHAVASRKSEHGRVESAADRRAWLGPGDPALPPATGPAARSTGRNHARRSLRNDARRAGARRPRAKTLRTLVDTSRSAKRIATATSS
jgi:hypothetical protein